MKACLEQVERENESREIGCSKYKQFFQGILLQRGAKNGAIAGEESGIKRRLCLFLRKNNDVKEVESSRTITLKQQGGIGSSPQTKRSTLDGSTESWDVAGGKAVYRGTQVGRMQLGRAVGSHSLLTA